ncbi:MAG: hypothetical protein LAT82_01460 [Nanoarchaeota archaeon]|nr:hypothetical protein [Nanoarchaeota archaeon]
MYYVKLDLFSAEQDNFGFFKFKQEYANFLKIVYSSNFLHRYCNNAVSCQGIEIQLIPHRRGTKSIEFIGLNYFLENKDSFLSQQSLNRLMSEKDSMEVRKSIFSLPSFRSSSKTILLIRNQKWDKNLRQFLIKPHLRDEKKEIINDALGKKGLLSLDDILEFRKPPQKRRCSWGN